MSNQLTWIGKVYLKTLTLGILKILLQSILRVMLSIEKKFITSFSCIISNKQSASDAKERYLGNNFGDQLLLDNSP